MLSDWLVIVEVFLEPLLDARTITTTISAITSAAPPAIAQRRPPSRPSLGGTPPAGDSPAGPPGGGTYWPEERVESGSGGSPPGCSYPSIIACSFHLRGLCRCRS